MWRCLLVKKKITDASNGANNLKGCHFLVNLISEALRWLLYLLLMLFLLLRCGNNLRLRKKIKTPMNIWTREKEKKKEWTDLTDSINKKWKKIWSVLMMKRSKEHYYYYYYNNNNNNALGTIPRNLKKRRMELEIWKRIETFQTKVISRSE